MGAEIVERDGRYEVVLEGMEQPLFAVEPRENDFGKTYVASWHPDDLNFRQFDEIARTHIGEAINDYEVTEQHRACADSIFEADERDYEYVELEGTEKGLPILYFDGEEFSIGTRFPGDEDALQRAVRECYDTSILGTAEYDLLDQVEEDIRTIFQDYVEPEA